MDQKVKETMQKVAEYIGEVQPAIDKFAEQRNQFVKKARQTAGVLASRGLIDYDNVDGFVDKVAEDATEVWTLVEKLATLIPTDSLGGPANEKMADGSMLDPFEKLALYGDARAEVNQSGMVE